MKPSFSTQFLISAAFSTLALATPDQPAPFELPFVLPVLNIAESETTDPAGPPPPCPADFNRDNTVDIFDYLDFVDAFRAETFEADFNFDGVIDFFDYLDFLRIFNFGC